MTRLIIFDFDGTLGDTRENIVKTMQETMRRMNLPVPDEATIATTIGIPLEAGFKIMQPGITAEKCAECAALYRIVFEEWKEKLVPKAFPGVNAILKELYENGYIMSVASSRKRPSLVGFIHDMGFEQYISYVLGVDDAPGTKPDPAPVLKTLEDLKVPAGETLVVGDMDVDILMGSRAGARTCGVTWGNGTPEAFEKAGADYIINSIEELPAIVAE